MHEWVVFSTALADGWLMLQCVECGSHGVVESPTATEWSEAFYAPSRPYRWEDSSRVVIKFGPCNRRYVARASQSVCECYTRRGIVRPEIYERIPLEVLGPSLTVRACERRELRDMIDVVQDGGLCSFLFSYFLRCAEADGFGNSSDAVKEVANRLEMIDRLGTHCSPDMVAKMLRIFSSPEYATRHSKGL